MSNASGKRKLLFVDDDEILLSIAENMLMGVYEFISARSGKQALEIIYKGLIPDLIVLDILLPNMDGWEIFRRLKAISFLHGVPIAFLTAVQGVQEEEYAKEIGAVDYIMKPFNENLLDRIERILNRV